MVKKYHHVATVQPLPEDAEFKFRVYIPYDKVISLLKSGQVAYVEGIRRQTAFKACKKLTKMIGEEVIYLKVKTYNSEGWAFLTRSMIGQIKSNFSTAWSNT